MDASDYFTLLQEIFRAEEQRLNGLDAAIGDGDHGATMLRGLSAAVAAPEGARAKAFMRRSGGASGTLFGLILHELESYLQGDGGSLAWHLARAAARIQDLGQVARGDKSMIDALAPAIATLEGGGSIGQAAEAAAAGRDATAGMAARRGRARYVEGAGVGHLDPGAASVQLILKALAEHEALS